MEYNPVGWFELPVLDMDRAKEFYTKLFGYEFEMLKMSEQVTIAMFPMKPEAKGAAGALVAGSESQPSVDGAVVYFSVMSVEESVARAKDLGADILMPRTDIGEHGWVAWVKDTEGNRIAVHSMKG